MGARNSDIDRAHLERGHLMTMTTRWAGALGLAVLLAGGFAADSIVSAQGRPNAGRRLGPRHERGQWAQGLALGRLELSADQRQQAQAVMQGQRQALTQIRERMGAARKALNAAVIAPQTDEAAIRAASADVAAVEADEAVIRAKIHSDVWAILTSEQQQKITDMRAKKAERAKDGAQRRQPRQQRRQAPPPPQQ
jgi:Spy/CpxP family protein refolding chaperone